MITGANAGIGKVTALELAKMGANIIIVCRNVKKGEEALKEIRRKSHSRSVTLLVADLSSQTSIRQCVQNFKDNYSALHVLINNAAIVPGNLTFTEDGIETQFAVNYLAGFLLSNLLLPVLKDSAPSRIINITSDTHKYADINFKDKQSREFYDPRSVYRQTKLLSVIFTFEMSRRLKNSGVTVNCIHPGRFGTKILGDYSCGGSSQMLRNTLYRILLKLRTPSPEKGVDMILRLATSSEFKGQTGKYFEQQKESHAASIAYDRGIGEKLWRLSADMANLD
jgi:NAD(P)-dependent dehydrogenase (short-subunit alcohol dehydrogenase family)